MTSTTPTAEIVYRTHYPWIAAWGQMQRRNHKWVRDVERAAWESQAPATTVYEDLDHRWVTLEDIEVGAVRRWLIRYAEQHHLTIPAEVLAVWADPEYAAFEQAHRLPFLLPPEPDEADEPGW